jgi:transposase InsO family protein
MCKLLKVSRSRYYLWRREPASKRQQEDVFLTEKVKSVFFEERELCGTRVIKNRLEQRGTLISRKRVARLLNEAGLVRKTKRKFQVTTDSKHNHFVAPNLLQRQFNPAEPNRVWAGDITYIPTRNGWLYLATVMDLYSRKVVGWSMDTSMKATLVNDALTMALWRRKPDKGLIWHSDQGSQYCSKSHRAILKDHGIQQSMSRKGNCWDNATSESFFSTIKGQLVELNNFADQTEASAAIFEYIEVFYNNIRAHSANGYRAPAEFEAMQNDTRISKKSVL